MSDIRQWSGRGSGAALKIKVIEEEKMLSKSRWIAVGSLLLCNLLNSPGYAAQPATADINTISIIPGPKPAAKTAARMPAPKPAVTEKQSVKNTPASGTDKVLSPPSLVESVLSLLLASVFLLVLFRSDTFKHD
ncbi:MAG: hypothetical protein ACU837_14710 [Gammaproteobacteria bacterium]